MTRAHEGTIGDQVESAIEMTMRYAHLSPDVPRQEVKLLDDVGSSAAKSSPLAGDRAVLKPKCGRLKADIDLHIAAAAIEADATLVTNDGTLLAGDIEGLVAENWI